MATGLRSQKPEFQRSRRSRFRMTMNPFGSNKTALDVNGGWSRAGIRGIGLARRVAVGIYLCYRLAQPCIPSLVWAGALALVFNPVPSIL